ncbi:MAG: fluoride efflux transporter CrcB [Actinomycetales bacterium]
MRGFGLVAVGGAAGCLARYVIDLLTHWDVLLAPSFPWPTLLINVSGCLIIGSASVFIAGRHRELQWRALVVTGFLGGCTTFSALALETVALLDSGLPLVALAYLAATLILGAVAVLVGAHLAGLLAARLGLTR